ncbi:hypothetical protein HYT52_05125 [Candidatus Woesearchaeota archaeon]|nr:hypothetical protein [Candidatus Woesearchaeota archaeon]
MTTDSVNLTCDRTNITKNNYFYGWGIYAVNRKNITINGCSIGGYLNNIYFNDVNDSIIYNSTIYGTGNGIYLSKSNRNNISHSEFIADLTFKMYSNNNSVYNSTFNGAGIHFIDSSQSGFNWINTPPSGNLFYFNTFVDFSNYVTRFDYLGINNILNNFNTTINGVNVGNSWEYICSGNLDFTDSDNNGWYDSGSDYPYNLSIHNSNALGLDYYPKVITCESEVFLGSSSSSSSTTTTSNPSAPPAPAAAPSTAVAAPAAVSASAPPNSFTAGEAGAYQFNPSLDLSQYTDLITKLADYGYTPEEFIQQAIRILILDQQDFSLAYKQIYSLLGTFGKGKLSKFSGITILDSFSALAFSIENKQLDLDAGETIDLDFTFDIPGITPVKLPATVTFEGKDIKDVEMNVQPKSDSGVFIKIDQEKDLGEIIIVIAPDGDSSTINEYAIEFSFIKKEEQDNLFAKVKSRLLGEETHAADYIDGIKVKGNEGGLYGFDFKYDSSSMSGKYLFTSTILEGTTVIAQNTYDLELE